MPGAPPLREAKSARFIAAERAETRIHLGADGQLPSLALDEHEITADTKSAVTRSSPIKLVAAVCFSAIMCVLMLLPGGGSSGGSNSAAQARQMIKDYYLNPRHGMVEIQPYQRELRLALQAHHRGAYREETTRYRNVLRMLKQDTKNPDRGITGQAVSDTDPSDSNLEALLIRLIQGT